jgi:hypothetical protein
VGNPADASTSRSAPAMAFPPLSRQTPDHLAVIQPPAVTRLTAHYRLRVIRRSRFAFAGPLPDAALALVRRFRACRRPSPRYQPGQPCRTKPSDTLGTPGSGAIETAPSPSRRARIDRGTSMPPMFSDSRCLPPRETIARALFRRSRSMARCSRWPTGAVAARVHRGSKTPTRPGTGHRCSRAFRRPRALLRLLQMAISTSTTRDHSNIPNHRIRGWDDCQMGSCLAIAATAGGTQGQGSR